MVNILCKFEEEDLRFQEELLTKLAKGNEKVIVHFDIIDSGKLFLARIYLAAADWPGLGETVIGLIHEKGYNVGFVYGVVSDDGKYAFMALKFPIKPENLKEVRYQLEEMTKEIKSFVGEGDLIKTKLVTTGIEKLEILEKIKVALKDLAFPEEFEDITRPGGELEKFVFSRSLPYLKEREPKLLAEIILVSHRFIRKLREVGLGVEVFIKNIKTEKEELTGLTVGGFEKEISMDEVFDLIKELFPSFQRKFDKEFITEDGISIIRIEFTVNKRPLTVEEIRKLEQHLKTNLRLGKIRVPLNLKFGGEIFGRALVPKMVEETMATGIPQVAIIPVEREKLTITFRIVIVSKESENYELVMSNLAKSDGYVLVSFKPPTKIKNVSVIFLTVRGLLSFFKDDIELFENLKNIIRESIGNFRDFDEGIRTLDRKNLEKITERIADLDIPDELARAYYFSIDDFIRTTLRPEKLLEDLIFINSSIKEHLINPSNKVFTREAKNYFSLAIIYQPDEKIFDKIFPLIEKYEPLLTRFEIYGLNVTYIEFNKKNLSVKEFNQLVQKIKEEMHHENYPVSH